MSPTVRYLTHPQVLIEPLKDRRLWSLNSVGSSRVARLASRLGILKQTRHVISSPETMALETACPLSDALGTVVHSRARFCEIDRSATGLLRERELERMAADFFSRPQKSIRGWETAVAAQRRIIDEVDASLDQRLNGDVLFVGHSVVGTLLLCSLSECPIDQVMCPEPGGGFWFEFDSQSRQLLCDWQPMEAL
jgi:broad specificity phosphatase PhoE